MISQHLQFNYSLFSFPLCSSIIPQLEWNQSPCILIHCQDPTQRYLGSLNSSKCLFLALRETQVQSLGGEDPLEKEIATHSSIHAWKIPWTEEPQELQSMGDSKEVRQDWVTSLSLSLRGIGASDWLLLIHSTAGFTSTESTQVEK